MNRLFSTNSLETFFLDKCIKCINHIDHQGNRFNLGKDFRASTVSLFVPQPIRLSAMVISDHFIRTVGRTNYSAECSIPFYGDKELLDLKISGLGLSPDSYELPDIPTGTIVTKGVVVLCRPEIRFLVPINHEVKEKIKENERLIKEWVNIINTEVDRFREKMTNEINVRCDIKLKELEEYAKLLN